VSRVYGTEALIEPSDTRLSSSMQLLTCLFTPTTATTLAQYHHPVLGRRRQARHPELHLGLPMSYFIAR
jgi:hypothetical protein